MYVYMFQFNFENFVLFFGKNLSHKFKKCQFFIFKINFVKFIDKKNCSRQKGRMEIVSKAFEKAFDIVMEVAIRQLAYIAFYKRNVNELRDCVDELERAKGRVRHQVEEAENNGKVIEADVTHWLAEVDKKITENETFHKDKGHGKTDCSMGLLPYLCFRHQLGRKAKKMTLDVKPLLEKSKFDDVSIKKDSTSMDVALSNFDYESFQSRTEVMGRIKAALEDSNVRMIGVFGPGGVGKTTLVKEVAKKAKEDNSFNVVVMVNVTRDPNLTKIQKEIADMLGLRLEEESEIARADRLRKRLKKEKENILIIIDDLWEGLDLNKLGISFDDDDFCHMSVKETQNSDSSVMKEEKSSSNYKECKILLTSRSREVLSTQMDVKMESIFSVGLLEENEAKTLFKKLVAKVPEKNSEFENLVDEIMEKCAGLPMAIIAVGKALRNKRYSEWKDALEQLNRQGFTGVHKSMEFSIKLSYDHLESEELKLTFLLCAEMGPHPLVMDLVKYCVGLGILEGVHTIREARNRIDKLIQKFKDVGLLLDSDSSDYFNMHDTVRDAALSIASKEQNIFTLRNCKLDEWPEKDELKRYTSISLHNCDIIDGLPESINCPRLKLFHIDNVDPSIRIPDNFFKGMKNLRVLILNGIHIPHLPSSIKYLTNLRMLCLERCMLGDNLFKIGELKKLRIMSFSGSKIEKFPGEIRQLVNLQWLDISNCSKLRVIPPNIVSSLTSLEELYLRNSLIQREVDEGETSQSLIVVLNELRYLHKLETLDICISNVAVMPKNLFFDKLDNYKIIIGDFKSLSVGDFKMPNKYETSRALALQLKEGNDIHSRKGIKILFKRVENLLLGELKGVCDALYELNLEGFSCLKHFSIYKNSDIQYIIKSMEIGHPHNVFTKLESLCLYKLENMENLFNNRLTDGSLCNLRTIKIQTCSRLKFLFSFDLVRLLTKLETIEVFKCNSLEEIVDGEIQEHTDTTVKDDKIEFPQLRFLALRTLPKFIGFYSNHETISISQSLERQVTTNELDEITEEEKHSISLFCEQVFIPNIESLELSSINIHKIWGYQPSLSFCFQKLTKLNVNECNRLKYLFSFSVAKNLENLKDLSVSDCEMMKEIFYPEKISMNEAKAIIFPKLENIRLTFMKKLSTIWHSQVCSEDSFRNLNSVVIEFCEQLVTVFPSHMIRISKNLVSLRVFSCDLVKAIFDLEDTLQKNTDGNETKLQRIVLMFLPNLKLVWSRDPKGILNFKNLQAIKVNRCSVLQHILPVSVAKDVQKLESLEASRCSELEEIVASMEEGSETSSNTFMFPQVTKLILETLPKLRRHNLEWKALRHMTVRDCEKMEVFTIDTRKFQQVIPSLEYMAIGLKEAECLRHCIGNYLMHNLKHLSLYSLNSGDIVYWFLYRIPNLEHLWLYNCPFEELLPYGSLAAQEKIGTVVQLKDLRFINLHDLQNIGMERDPVLQRVESLTLRDCPQLIELASSSVSFTHLTYLEVSWCHRLMNLMGYSTAKSLVLLTTMKVMRCEAMEEIVAKEGNEEKVVNIVFSKLITLELVDLKNLSSFCSSKNLAFDFPSLENLIVRECYKMKIFTKGVTSAPNLQKVRVEVDQDGDSYWEGGLNSTIRNLGRNLVARFARNVRYLDLVDHPELEEIWHGIGPVSDKNFSNLKTLVVQGCDFLSCVIPSHLVPFLSKLEVLRVGNCDSVKVIFDMKNTGASPLPLALKNLTLKELPNLKHVWNKDQHGIIKLQTLEEVYIDGCKGLKSLFPVSVAKDLVKLETLNVENCEELVEIVAMDGMAEEEGKAQRFVLPCVASLKFRELPELKCFYPGPHELEWPGLKELYVYHCDKLKIFTPEFQNYQESLPENQLITPFAQQALFSIEKVFPNLNKLSLNGKDTMMLWHEAFPENLLHNLKLLWLICFHNIGKADSLLSKLFHKVPNIEKLRVCCSGFEELFPSQTLEVECIRVPTKLKQLHLERLSRLKSIGLEHSWLHPLLQTLENLKLDRCPCLTKLVQFAISFSNLKQLNIFECHGLEYLFTSSTVRGLVRLEQMYIEKCKSIKEIVAKEGDESAEEEIIFEQLKKLSLRLLPSLVSFYNGNSTLIFQYLETVTIDQQCPKMKIFSQGVINAPRLKKIVVSYLPRWKGDLNATIEELFNEQVPYQYLQDLKLSEYPELEQVWLGELSLPENCFRNLKSLVMENLKFISKAVPSHLLPFLKSLKELQVRSCTSVEVIFDAKSEKTTFRLEKLTLDELPNMKHVWNKDPQGAFRFESLQEVHVTNCEGLKALFPQSMAKNLVKLEKLRIETCNALEEIVGKEEVAAEGTTARFLFPCLTSVTLNLLPELKCFYNEKHNLQCPILQDLRVYHCCKLKIFTSDSQSYQEARPEDHVGISFQKVIPKVEELSLSEEETVMFWHGDYAANLLNRLICLQLCCFHNVKEAETLPWGFLQKVPKIETLAVACSDFEEIFPSQGVDVDVNVMRIFAQLNGLRVENLSKLNSIGLEHPWLDTLRENLKILEVCRCPCLTKLIQSPISFSNLRELLLNKCDGLIYLFTSSTAKSLVSLKRMSVEECESLKEIVATERDESSQDNLIFEKLRKLSLNSLPCLASFYAGSSVLKFPSLGELIIAQCPTMKFFSQGLVIAPILIEIQASMNKDDLLWEVDLNSTVEKMFKEKVLLESKPRCVLKESRTTMMP